MTTKKRDGRAFCSSVPFFGGSIFRVSELIYNEKNIFLILQILHSIYYKQYLKYNNIRFLRNRLSLDTDRTRKERSDGIAIVRTCKLLFFYMQKSAIASPIRLLDVAKKTSLSLVFSVVLLIGFVRSGATD